jgi:hypothetical protein
MSVSRILQFCMTLTVFITMMLPVSADAQVPPRFYWKNLLGGHAVPVIFMDISGNANPLDGSDFVIPDAQIDAKVAVAGYAHTFSLFNRPAMVAALLPVGRVSGEATLFGKTFNQNTNGFGDPTFEFVLGLIGPPPMKNIPDVMRYEPGFSLDLLVDLIVPIGEYDNEAALNMGQNRWYGRVGAPIVWQLGNWVPGRRTTLEFLPSIWLYGDNNDFVGNRLSTDPKFQLESHLTRDFHTHLWGSADLNYVSGGKSSINGVSGENLDMLGLGFTLGYNINENIQVTAGYMATVGDSEPTDLSMDSFKLSLVFGWHPLVEGMKRLGGE